MTEPENIKRGWSSLMLPGIATLLVVALVIVPGYIAGFYCGLTHDMTSLQAIDYGYEDVVPVEGPAIGLRIFLAPSRFAAEIAPPLSEIYKNQFLHAARTFKWPM